MTTHEDLKERLENIEDKLDALRTELLPALNVELALIKAEQRQIIERNSAKKALQVSLFVSSFSIFLSALIAYIM
jgi:hypothetical protein